SQTLRPLTIRQLLSASQPIPDQPFRLDGAELSQVTFVARILDVQEQSTNVTYKVEDGTGEAEVRWWLDGGEGDWMARRRAQLVANTYCRIVGHFRSFNNKKSLVAFSVRPVEDANEITYHNLAAISVHLYLTRGTPGVTGGAANTSDGLGSEMDMGIYGGLGGGMGMGGGIGGMGSTGVGGSIGVGGGAPQPQYAQPAQSVDIRGDFTPIQQAILRAAKRSTTSEGVNIYTVANACRTFATEQDVRNAVEFLIGEGHLYSTIDDNHFKVSYAFQLPFITNLNNEQNSTLVPSTKHYVLVTELYEIAITLDCLSISYGFAGKITPLQSPNPIR
ncbi:nucleic acid-binding protein, partial [Gonapodya prolifera JEL478]